MSATSDSARFDLYVKAASDGRSLGDCPFSQRANMFLKIKLADDMYQVKPVDMANKPKWFLDLNPAGSAPVLIDHKADAKVITDSAEITKYIDDLFPEPSCLLGYDGEGKDACMGIFGKFAAFLKNRDDQQDDQLRTALVAELSKLNSFIEQNQKGSYLLGNELSELDCLILPRLRHVEVAGKRYKNFEIPEEFVSLRIYMNYAKGSCNAFKATCCPDSEIIHGWSKHMS